VRLGPQRARWGYLALVLGAYGMLPLLVLVGALPVPALLGLIALPLSLRAAADVLRFAATPARLAPAIRLTIAAMLLHSVTLSLGLVLAA